jgi:hypothetical protein
MKAGRPGPYLAVSGGEAESPRDFHRACLIEQWSAGGERKAEALLFLARRVHDRRRTMSRRFRHWMVKCRKARLKVASSPPGKS